MERNGSWWGRDSLPTGRCGWMRGRDALATGCAAGGDTLTTFGIGLSPFFLSLSLWLGALILHMVFAPLNRRAVDSGASPLRAALTVVVPGLIMSLIQATCLWLVQVFAGDVLVGVLWGAGGDRVRV